MAAKHQDVIVEEGAVYVLRAGTSIFIKTNDLCAMTGKSNQWIGQLVSQGILNKRSTSHGALFDMIAVTRAYCDMLEARGKAPEDKDAAEAEKKKGTAELTIKQSKAIVSALEAKELQGKMHRSEDVAAMTEDLIYTIRGMLLALPGRLAVDAVNAKTAAEASEVIKVEVHNIMRELSRYRYDAAKYEERVRERRNWDAVKGGQISDDDEG